MSAVTLTLTMVNAEPICETTCLRFSLVRERYLPYASLTAAFVCGAVAYGSAARAILQMDGVTLHDGMVDSLEERYEEGRRILTLRSRGFAAAMLSNQPVPGLHSNVTLAALMTAANLPYVTYENGVTGADYIWVPERSSLWETIVQFNYKLNGGYPFVRANNHVRVTPLPAGTAYSVETAKLLAVGKREDTVNMISKIDMADASGDYGAYTASCAAAVARNLVRVQKIALDRRFLYQPQQALSFRIACGMRRQKESYAEYLGYQGEDIEDAITFVGFDTGRVGRVEITADAKGLRTRTSIYKDAFCNS